MFKDRHYYLYLLALVVLSAVAFMIFSLFLSPGLHSHERREAENRLVRPEHAQMGEPMRDHVEDRIKDQRKDFKSGYVGRHLNPNTFFYGYEFYYPETDIGIVPFEGSGVRQGNEGMDADYDHRYSIAEDTGGMYLDASETISDEKLDDLRLIVGLDLDVVHADDATFERLLSLTNLESLKVSGNITRIPAGISRLTRLDWLDLSGNQITEVPAEIGKLRLETLILSNNKIENLPVDIASIPTLRGLFIAKNGIESLPKALLGMTNLKNLDISGNKPALYRSPEVRQWLSILIANHAQVRL